MDGAHGNLVQGNWIGTNSAGNGMVGTSNVGIIIGVGAHNNVLDANVVAGHGDYGILVFKEAASNEIKNNRLGISAFDDRDFGIGTRGVEVMGNGNYIHHNRISNNGNGGVRIKSGMNNRISQNQIFNNSTLGIGIGADAFTENDSGDRDSGANGLQNFPVLNVVNNSGGTLNIQGTLNSRPNQNYVVELFYNNVCGNAFNKPAGEGQAYLTSVNISTDGGGNGGFSVNVGNSPTGGVITATATDSQNNTSEFSFCRGIIVVGPSGPSKPVIQSPANGSTTSETHRSSIGVRPKTRLYIGLCSGRMRKTVWLLTKTRMCAPTRIARQSWTGTEPTFGESSHVTRTSAQKSAWATFKTP